MSYSPPIIMRSKEKKNRPHHPPHAAPFFSRRAAAAPLRPRPITSSTAKNVPALPADVCGVAGGGDGVWFGSAWFDMAIDAQSDAAARRVYCKLPHL